MFIEMLKAVLFGIVEGITEWLPVSSTGHLILLDEFIKLDVTKEFYEMFQVVIQLGAIAAVLVLFFHKLNPFSPKKKQIEKRQTWQLWFKVVVAVLPSAVLGFLFDEWLEENVFGEEIRAAVVAIALIVYGVVFLFLEKRNSKDFRIRDVHEIDYRTALFIGAFQCLSLIPGTSRSGSTILGGILLSVSRPAAAEFSFFLAIPTMVGASALKIYDYFFKEHIDPSGVAVRNIPTGMEIADLIVGTVVSFVVSLLVIKGLMEYVRKRSFSAFGVYRIILGALVLGYYLYTLL